MKDVLDKSIEELELGVRAYNCLKNANIYTLKDLVSKTESDLLKTKHFGRKSLQQVKHVWIAWDCRWNGNKRGVESCVIETGAENSEENQHIDR